MTNQCLSCNRLWPVLVIPSVNVTYSVPWPLFLNWKCSILVESCFWLPQVLKCYVTIHHKVFTSDMRLWSPNWSDVSLISIDQNSSSVINLILLFGLLPFPSFRITRAFPSKSASEEVPWLKNWMRMVMSTKISVYRNLHWTKEI